MYVSIQSTFGVVCIAIDIQWIFQMFVIYMNEFEIRHSQFPDPFHSIKYEQVYKWGLTGQNDYYRKNNGHR